MLIVIIIVRQIVLSIYFRLLTLVWLTPSMRCDGFRFRSYASLRFTRLVYYESAINRLSLNNYNSLFYFL